MELPYIYDLAGHMLRTNGKDPLTPEQRVQLEFMLVGEFGSTKLQELDEYIRSAIQRAQADRSRIASAGGDKRAQKLAVQVSAVLQYTEDVDKLLCLMRDVLLSESSHV